MQYVIAGIGADSPLAAFENALRREDPSALLDVDTRGALRVATGLGRADLVAVLALAGIAADDVEVLTQGCCGGCGG